ncbi:MAG: hypothetical protein J6V50_05245 [Clostridia bacterium]|nr:hypothetical protein [Clostridia bacterium]
MTSFNIPGSSVVKITAKTAIAKRKNETGIVSFFGMFAFLIMNLIAAVIASNDGRIFEILSYAVTILFAVFVLAPLFFGIIRFFWRMTDGVEDEISSVFYYFGSRHRYFRILKLNIVMFLRIIIPLFICLLPYITVGLISGSQIYALFGFDIPLWAPNLVLIKNFLYIIGVAAALGYISRYYLVPILAVANEELLLLEAVHLSTMVAKRSISSFLSLVVSLLPWIILTVLVIPAFYTLSIIIVCYVVHCRFAINNYNILIDNFENDMSGYYYEEE